MQNEITSGNYKATVKAVVDCCGDCAFRVTVAYMDRGVAGIDAASDRVRFSKNFGTEKAAMTAARRELAKCA